MAGSAFGGVKASVRSGFTVTRPTRTVGGAAKSIGRPSGCRSFASGATVTTSPGYACLVSSFATGPEPVGGVTETVTVASAVRLAALRTV